MKRTKRTISFILALLMCASLLLGSVSADAGEEYADEPVAAETAEEALTEIPVEETAADPEAEITAEDAGNTAEDLPAEAEEAADEIGPEDAADGSTGDVFLFNDIFNDVIDENSVVEELLCEEVVFETAPADIVFEEHEAEENNDNPENGFLAAPLNALRSVFISGAHAEEEPHEVFSYRDSDAAVLLRKTMVNREGRLEINVRNTGDAPAVLAANIVSMATAHTGVPYEGDYIAWQGLRAAWSSSEGDNYISFVFLMNYFTTAQQEAEVDAKVDEVLNELNVSTADTFTKIRTVYDYVAGSVYYDNYNINNPASHTAYNGFMENRCVCQGYSLMIYRLLLELNVDVRLITGYGDGNGHAWNMIGIDGVYYYADATWDAGSKKYNGASFTGQSAEFYTFFLDGNTHFSRRHYPKCFFVDGTSTKPSTGTGIYVFNCDVRFYNVSNTPYAFGAYAVPSEERADLVLGSTDASSKEISFAITGALPDSFSVKCSGLNGTLLAKTQISEISEGRFSITFSTNSRRGNAEYAVYLADDESGLPAGSVSVIPVSAASSGSELISVTFDSKGGTGGPSVMTAESGASLRLSTEVPDYPGYVFDHWEKQVTNPETGAVTKTSYKPGAIYSFSEDTTLVAIYLSKTYSQYTLSFNANGGTCSAEPVTVYYRDLYGELPVAENGNRIFLGWFTASNGGTRITETSRVTRTASHALYAHWGPDADWAVSSEESFLQQGDRTQLIITGAADTDLSRYELELGLNGDFTADVGEYVSVDESGVLTALKPGAMVSVRAVYTDGIVCSSKTVDIRLIQRQLQLTPPEGTPILTHADAPHEGWYGIDCNGNFVNDAADAVSYALYVERSASKRSFAFKASVVDEEGLPAAGAGDLIKVGTNAKSIASAALGVDGMISIDVKANAVGACSIRVALDNGNSESVQLYVMDFTPKADSGTIVVNTLSGNAASLRLVPGFGNAIDPGSLKMAALNNKTGKYTEDVSSLFELKLEDEVLSVIAKQYISDRSIKTNLIVCCGNTEYDPETGEPLDPYRIPLVIKVRNKNAVLKPEEKNLSLNLFNTELKAETSSVLSEGDISSVKAAVLTPLHASSEADKILVTYSGGMISASLKNDGGNVMRPAKGSYTFRFTPVRVIGDREVDLPEVRIAVKVAEKAPEAVLERKVLNLNLRYQSAADGSLVNLSGETEGFSLKDIYGFSCRNDHAFSGVSFETCNDGSGALIGFSAKLKGYPDAKKYTYIAFADIQCPDGRVMTRTLNFSVNISGKEPAVNKDRSSVTLNSCSLYAGSESARITFSLDEAGLLFDSFVIEPIGSNTAEADKIYFESDPAGGTVAFSLDTYDVPVNGTYVFKVTPMVSSPDNLERSPAASQKVTVKVICRADVGASVSLSGKLDALDRNGSKVRITLNALKYISGEVKAVRLEGDDADRFIFGLTENEKGQKVVVLKLRSAAAVSTADIYRVTPVFILEDGTRVPAPVQKIRVVQSKLSLSAEPASAVYFQSQGRERMIEYRVKLNAPVSARISEQGISFGKTAFWQKSLEKQAKSIAVSVSGNVATICVTLKDSARFVSGTRYYLPVLFIPEGSAQNASPAKINLGMVVKK